MTPLKVREKWAKIWAFGCNVIRPGDASRKPTTTSESRRLVKWNRLERNEEQKYGRSHTVWNKQKATLGCNE